MKEENERSAQALIFGQTDKLGSPDKEGRGELGRLTKDEPCFVHYRPASQSDPRDIYCDGHDQTLYS